MRKILLAVLVGCFATATFAQENNTLKGKQLVAVKGNCGMCKKTIEKAAYSVKGVRSAEWSADNQEITLYVNAKKTTLLEVEKAIAKSGYDTKNVKATDEDYNDLHSCCKYDRG